MRAAREFAAPSRARRPFRGLPGAAVSRVIVDSQMRRRRSLLLPTGQPRMNPKHFHTPVSTRLRCPVCHQPVYSRGGIHPQCAMRQSEPPMPKPEDAIVVDCRPNRKSSWP